MVVADQRRNLGQGGMLSDHVRSNVGMAPHDFPLFFSQRPGLIQNVVPNPNLSEIVK
jgi:hypothetical protein